jgi:putative transposase
MPRTARKVSESGIYHVILRGINRQVIFLEDDDYQRFIDTLSLFKKKSGYELYAYCLMSNHIHLVIKENDEKLAQIMRRICGSFVY